MSAHPTSLYVHVPFCVAKCAYCDFVSRPGAGAEESAAYVDAVLAEVERYAGEGLLADVPSLYVGGGTPTALGDQLVRLVSGVRERVGLAPDAEITVETNPDTTTGAIVRSLLSCGVNRFSLGVQSFDAEVLRALGRCHDLASAVRAAAIIHDTGVPFSIDLICGVPGQGEGSWMGSVLRAISTGAGHVSVYPLTVEEGTPLAAAIEAGTSAEPDPDHAARDMESASELLEAAGLVRYETANYARPGEESVHNLGYWTGRPYLGIGPGASSMLPLDGGARRRWTATSDIDAWIADPSGSKPAEVETLSHAEVLREDAMLGLRVRDGITGALAEAAGATQTLHDLSAAGLVEHVEPDDTEQLTHEPDRWRLTKRGWLLGNEVFARVWNGD